MGYSTSFTGEWKIEPPLAPEHLAYLKQFSVSRRMKRDLHRTEKLSDPLRRAVGLPLGPEGGYYVGPDGDNGQRDLWRPKDSPDDRHGILDSNTEPDGQPGLWCKWAPNADGTAIGWDGREKFYEYATWAEYLLDHFLTPWGYKLSGRVDWQGEEENDTGYMVVYNGRVFVNEDPILEKIADAL